MPLWRWRLSMRCSHRAVIDALSAKGIMVNPHYMPVNLRQQYHTLGFSAGRKCLR
jgi:hypothetical protein